ELAILDVRRLRVELEGGEHSAGDALAAVAGGRAHVGLHLGGRAFAGGRRRQTGASGASRDSRQDDASAARDTDASAARDTIEHVRDLLCYAAAGGGRGGAQD